MKRTTHLLCLTVCVLTLLPAGCKQAAPPAESGADSHAALHQTKYNQTLVEFPGHQYAMEIIDDEASGLVSAFITDAHFSPIEVDAAEVRLNFIVNGAPKTFTLTRNEPASGQSATFTLTNKELAVLNCDGWQGEATASVEIGGTPYNATLKRLAEHNHEEHDHSNQDHAGHGHSH